MAPTHNHNPIGHLVASQLADIIDIYHLFIDSTQNGYYPSQIRDDAMEALSFSNALFSKVQQRVLALIFGQPERSFYTSEIVRNVQSGTGAVERELSRLRRSGLVSVERVGNQKHYRANRDSPVFEELRSLVRKTIGLANPIRESLEPYADKIKTAFIYGSVAKGTDTAQSDVDLMVIGNELNYSDLYSALQDAGNILRREVNPIFLSESDWSRKAADKDSVVSKIMHLPKIFIIGSEKDLHDGQTRTR
jgi:predicted nucleotidyltransferase